MRLPDDDEVYDVDGHYLGPKGHFIGRFRYRALFLGPTVFALGLVVLAQTGVGYSLLSVGLLAVGTVWVTGKVVDNTSSERPTPVVLSVLPHEVAARRESSTRQHAAGPKFRPERVRLGTAVPGARRWRRTLPVRPETYVTDKVVVR